MATAKKTAKKPAAKKPSAKAGAKRGGGFSAAERAAMKERAAELKAASARKGKAGAAEDEKDVLAKIAAMAPEDRAMAKRLHAIVKEVVPDVAPRLWYGMPAYAVDGKVLCFFQDARRFKTRYATLGFSDKARLDDGSMWPAGFALMDLDAAAEKQIRALLARAAR